MIKRIIYLVLQNQVAQFISSIAIQGKNIVSSNMIQEEFNQEAKTIKLEQSYPQLIIGIFGT